MPLLASLPVLPWEAKKQIPYLIRTCKRAFEKNYNELCNQPLELILGLRRLLTTGERKT